MSKRLLRGGHGGGKAVEGNWRMDWFGEEISRFPPRFYGNNPEPIHWILGMTKDNKENKDMAVDLKFRDLTNHPE